MKPEVQTLDRAIAGSAWISSVELGAGIYFLDGRTHVAGHCSPAERLLVDRGALLVASIRFDEEPGERYHAAQTVRRLGNREAVHVLGGRDGRT